jgi:acyl-coenzyme A thioesterase PaaI-like protein
MLTTLVLRKTVPFLGSAGIRFVSVEPDKAVLSLPDKRAVHNHLHGVHASAAALLAEATSGLLLALHLPDDKVPLLARMEVDYLRRIDGGLTAVARLDDATKRRIVDEPSGETTFLVDVRDDSGQVPLKAAMTWAWREKRKP